MPVKTGGQTDAYAALRSRSVQPASRWTGRFFSFTNRQTPAPSGGAHDDEKFAAGIRVRSVTYHLRNRPISSSTGTWPSLSATCAANDRGPAAGGTAAAASPRALTSDRKPRPRCPDRSTDVEPRHGESERLARVSLRPLHSGNSASEALSIDPSVIRHRRATSPDAQLPVRPPQLEGRPGISVRGDVRVTQ